MKSSRLPLSVIVVDLACLAFGAWTLLCNAVVLLSGTSITLLVVSAFGLVAAGAWFASRARRSAFAAFFWGESAAAQDASLEDERVAEPGPRDRLVRLLSFVAGEVVLARFAVSGDRLELCALCIGLFALGYALLARDVRAPVAADSRVNEWLIWALALGCCVISLVAHRPNSDDALYVNMGVSVADFPHQALLSHDTLHGSGAAFKVTVYRATSIEVLWGLLSLVTRIPTITFAHIVLPAIVALLIPLAHARLFRVLDPARFAYAAWFALLFMLFDSAGRGSYGTFVFGRLFQGKAMMLGLGLPLITAYGLRFGLAPSRARFALLSAAQIGALGLSVTAFWAAPIAAMLAVASAVPLRGRSLRTLALSALSSGYVLGLGLCMKLVLSGGVAALTQSAASAAGSGDEASEDPAQGADLLTHAYQMVLGKPPALWRSIALVLLTWPLCRTALGRRFALVVPLGFFASLGNPALVRLFSSLTTPEIHWRVLWLLPLPVLCGLCFSAVLEPQAAWRNRVGPAVLCGYLFLHFVQIAPRSVLARASFDWPHPKLDLHAYRVAQEIVRVVPAHSQVLAPLAVSRVLPMLNGYSYPLFIKTTYVMGSNDERVQRKRLTMMVGRGRGHDSSEGKLAAAIEQYKLAAVVLQKEHGKKQRLAHTLGEAGFHLTSELENTEIWTRPRSL